jgi:hypothetical protein
LRPRVEPQKGLWRPVEDVSAAQRFLINSIMTHRVLLNAQLEAIVMRRVVPIHVFEPFDFDTINQMQSAFSEAVAIVEAKIGGTVPDSVRESLALRIIECAQRGVEGSTWVAEAVEHWQGTPSDGAATNSDLPQP